MSVLHTHDTCHMDLERLSPTLHSKDMKFSKKCLLCIVKRPELPKTCLTKQILACNLSTVLPGMLLSRLLASDIIAPLPA